MGGATRVTWRGRTFDARTRDMLVEVQRLVGDGVELIPVQGSYSLGSASAGTHAGGGAVDLRTWHLGTVEKVRLVTAMRLVGFAAWYRYPPKFDQHVHGIAIGCPDLSFAATNQVKDYKAGRNGLANRGPDDGPRVGFTTWEEYKAREDDEDMATPQDMWSYRNDAVERGDTYGLLVESYRRSGEAMEAAKYANDQLTTVARALKTIATALADGKVDVAELKAVSDRLSGK